MLKLQPPATTLANDTACVCSGAQMNVICTVAAPPAAPLVVGQPALDCTVINTPAVASVELTRAQLVDDDEVV